MRLITGAGIAGALVLTGGTTTAAFSQTAFGDTPAVTAAATGHQDEISSDDDTESTEPADDTGDASNSTDVAGALGRAHAEAMQAWAQCVADAASGPKTVRIVPKSLCGPKPEAPGRILQRLGLADDTTEDSADTDESTDSDESTEADESTDADESSDDTFAEDSAGGHGWATSHREGHRGGGERGHDD